ncbi:hypothetical protein HYW75_01520 [Candidatus Pacearchaeota archaeon]|nr:hypothetical protein [Candidatus Pacearchaeota archaeon]
MKEFREHLNEINEKSGLNYSELLTFFLLLGQRVRFYKIEEFKEFFNEAKEISVDVDDIEYFALALMLNCPIWSQDGDMKKQNKIEILTTIELMKII